jgi:hypothetical protein
LFRARHFCISSIHPEKYMFTSLNPDSNPRRFLTFIVSLCLQVAVLLAIGGGPRFSQISGPSLRAHAAHSAVTPIYFRPDTAATPDSPEAAPSAPQLASEAHIDAEQASNTQAGTPDGTDESDGHGLAPFASWSMNAAPSGSNFMHHQFKDALPVFTPDPPILHGKVPESARGKEMVLELVINDQGSIVQATILKGADYGVEIPVMETLQRWIFVPAKVNGYAIASRRRVSFHFDVPASTARIGDDAGYWSAPR